MATQGESNPKFGKLIEGRLQIDQNTTDDGLEINQNAVLAPDQHALKVYSNTSQINAPLALIKNDASGSNQAALFVENDGTGNCLTINQDGSGTALSIDTEVANDGVALNIDLPGATGTGAFQVVRNTDVTSGAVCLRLGSGYLWVDATGDLRVSPTNPSSDTGGVVVGSQS